MQLSKEGKFTFSYSPSISDAQATVTSTFTQKTIREILSQIFNGKVNFKEKGNYIILTRSAESIKKSTDEALVITGYVVNAATGEKISEVSVYDRKTFAAAVTNEYGFFKLKIDKPSATNAISVSKKNFQDTLLMISPGTTDLVTISLQPEGTFRPLVNDQRKLDSLEENISVDVPEFFQVEDSQPLTRGQVNVENIRDTLHRDFQISLVPFVGTNRKLSGNVVNDYSFNIFGGYAMGVRKFELGGLFNTVRGDVSKVQIAGIFNAVGGNVSGFQASGYLNFNRGTFDGVQIGGNLNVNLSEAKGYQVAGLINLNGGASEGAMIAGIGNLQIQNYRGPQIASIFNISTHRVDGLQLGLLNFGRSVHGSQIGLLNIADSVKGAQFGLLSLVRTGYHKIELSADEVFYTNIAFRTGTRYFYNILTVGIKPDTSRTNFWTVGYGIGTAPKITKWLYLNLDLTANQVSYGEFTPALNLLNKFYMGFDFQVAKKFSITAGVTLNAYFTEKSYAEYTPLFTDYKPNLIYDEDIDADLHVQMWWGGKIGIRFF